MTRNRRLSSVNDNIARWVDHSTVAGTRSRSWNSPPRSRRGRRSRCRQQDAAATGYAPRPAALASSNTTGRRCSAPAPFRLSTARASQRADGILHARHGHDEAQIDDFDRLIGRGMAVAPIVLRVKARRVPSIVAGQSSPASATAIGNGVFLAAVAQVRGEVEFDRRARSIARQRLFAGGAQLGKGARRAVRSMLPNSPISVRTKSCRHAAISMPSAEKVPGSFGMTTLGMEISRAMATACSGPAPPNAIMRRVARVDAAIDRDRPHRKRHGAVGDGGDAERGRHRIEAEPVAESLRIAASRGARSSVMLAAEKARVVEPAEHEIGIGHGRLVAAAAVAGRPRIGAGAARPDMQAAARRRTRRSSRRRRRPRRCRPPAIASAGR